MRSCLKFLIDLVHISIINNAMHPDIEYTRTHAHTQNAQQQIPTHANKSMFFAVRSASNIIEGIKEFEYSTLVSGLFILLFINNLIQQPP